MKQAIRLHGHVQELASVEVERLIGTGQMARIRSVDPEPFFFGMTLAHEGTSTGSLNGISVVKEWLARVVRAVAHAFTPQGRVPAAIYDGIDHWHGNEGQRVAVGEVVDARPVDRYGFTTAQAVGWVYPAYQDVRTFIRTGARDCCSMESDITSEIVNGRVIVEDVLRGVAVVLGHTSKQTPGFAGAKLHKISEFGPAEAVPADPAGAPTGMGASTAPAAAEAAPASASPSAPAAAPAAAPTLTKDQLVTAIKEAGLKPADIWPPAPQPLPAPVATPPEQQVKTVDPLSAEGNPFLPA